MTWDNKARPNGSARIPFGYVADPDNPLLLFPDEPLVALVEEALDYLENGHPTRKVAEWLTEKGGRKISHQGIILIWRKHRPTSKRIAELDKATKKRKPKTRKDKKIAAVKRKRADGRRVASMMTNKLAAHEDNQLAIHWILEALKSRHRNRKLYSPQILGHKPTSWQRQREKSCSAEQRVEEKVSPYLQIPCAIFQMLHSVDSSFAAQTTNCVNWFSSRKNSTPGPTQGRSGRKRKASGSSRQGPDYG